MADQSNDPDGSHAFSQRPLSAVTEKFASTHRDRWDLSFARIVESINDGILVVDLDGSIIYTNPTMADLLGYSPEELIDRPVFDFMSPEWAEDTRRRLQERSQGEADEYDLLATHRDGSNVWLRISALPLRNEQDQPCASLVAATDITTRKQMERQLVEARQQAEEANRAKSEFLARMSHEIRTPMNGVLGMLELLADSQLDERQTEHVQMAQGAAEGLLSLINDILDFSKIEARELSLNPVPFSPHELLSETLQALSRHHKPTNVELTYHIDDDVPPRLLGDPDRLRQILINLVKNALKFTTQGRVSVHLTLHHESPKDPDTVDLLFRVQDTGQGIDEDQQAHIFEAFHQAAPPTGSRESGTGLGLTIASQLVALMEGDIWFESTPGEGSTFSFTIHLRPAHSLVEDSVVTDEDESPGEIAPLDILLAEDNPVNQRVSEGLLEKRGHSITIAEDGLQALDLWRDGDFDLILMDIQMPHLDGIDTTREIRRIEQKEGHDRPIPIVALTAHAMAGDREHILESGFDAYLAKPVRPDELYDTLHHIGSSRLEPSSG